MSGKILNIVGALTIVPIIWILSRTYIGLEGLAVAFILAPFVLLNLSVLLSNGIVTLLVKTKHKPVGIAYAPTIVTLMMFIWYFGGFILKR